MPVYQCFAVLKVQTPQGTCAVQWCQCVLMCWRRCAGVYFLCVCTGVFSAVGGATARCWRRCTGVFCTAGVATARRRCVVYCVCTGVFCTVGAATARRWRRSSRRRRSDSRRTTRPSRSARWTRRSRRTLPQRNVASLRSALLRPERGFRKSVRYATLSIVI